MDSALWSDIAFWSMMGIAIIMTFVVIGFLVWKSLFNVVVWVIEKRGDRIAYWRKIKAKRVVDNDGNVTYQVFTFNLFKPRVYIKPPSPKDIYRIGIKDMLIVSKNSRDEYCPVRYNYDEDAFENIPAEVGFWASNTRRHRQQVHKQGVNWALVGAFAVVTFGLIISLVMVILTLDFASSMTCSGGQVSSNFTIPLIGQ